MMSTDIELVNVLLAHTGGPYIFGAKWPLSNPNPTGGVDCSGFVRWGLYQLGVPFPDGSWNQLAACRNAGTVITVAEAIDTPGALLFEGPNGETHIAVSRGDQTTVEARGHVLGVGSWTTTGRPWSYGARVPGLTYGTGALVVQPEYNPPLNLHPIVSSCPCPTGGAWLLGDDGGVYAVGGAPFLGSPLQDHHGENWTAGNRKAARITPRPGGGYVVTDTADEMYQYAG